MTFNFHFRDKHIDTITKVNYFLTNYLTNEYLNATVNYTLVPSWGYFNNETGLWDGMIGELVNNVADLGASPLFFTENRIPVIEYLAMTSATRSKFIFRSPKLSYTENVFLLPFDDVWLYLWSFYECLNLYIISIYSWSGYARHS